MTPGGPENSFTFDRHAQGHTDSGHFLTTVLPRQSQNKTVFWTGSSQFDPVSGLDAKPNDLLNYNSEKCVSRFGIQDAVGNIKERTADRIFCNIDGREMYLTKEESTARSSFCLNLLGLLE